MTGEARGGGCLGALFGQRATVLNEEAPDAAPDVRMRADFLSTAERSFFHAAELATRGRYLVMTKVNLGDLFFSPTRDYGDLNRIARKHVDFLLCDTETLRPVLGIELDDSSHTRAGAVKGDAVKDAAFASAGLPLMRVPARRGYATAELSAYIDDAIGERWAAAGAPAAALTDTPTCPRCGVAMVMRPGVDGRYDAFFGCTNYPRCRERRTLPAQ